MAMKAVLFRTGSGSAPAQSQLMHSSHRFSTSLPVNDCFGNPFVGEKGVCASPKISLQLEINRWGIRRASSESDALRSEVGYSGRTKSLSKLGSQSFPSKILEEEYVAERAEIVGSLTLIEDDVQFGRDRLESGAPMIDFDFTGGNGIGKYRKTGGEGGDGDACWTGGNPDLSKIGTYYQEIVKSNPTDSLLLRNYAKYLHEVERDTAKAEEYYGRAILASPGDGELLSLYAKLIWETQRDESRAKSYFDQAVTASPDDCTVLGSYAHFMWETEEEEEEN